MNRSSLIKTLQDNQHIQGQLIRLLKEIDYRNRQSLDPVVKALDSRAQQQKAIIDQYIDKKKITAEVSPMNQEVITSINEKITKETRKNNKQLKTIYKAHTKDIERLISSVDQHKEYISYIMVNHGNKQRCLQQEIKELRAELDKIQRKFLSYLVDKS